MIANATRKSVGMAWKYRGIPGFAGFIKHRRPLREGQLKVIAYNLNHQNITT